MRSTPLPSSTRAILVAMLLAMLLAAALPATSPAQVIDDFESGPFSLGGTVFDSSLQSGLPLSHCIAADRDVRLFINGNPTGADLNLGAADDEVTTVFGDLGGRLEFRYDPPLTDLTGGGSLVSIRVHLTVAEPAGRLEMMLEDDTGVAALVTRTIVGSGAYLFPYSEFVGVDPARIEAVQFNLEVPDFGDYHISDIRPYDQGGTAMDSDVLVGQIEGPPYPTPALEFATSFTGPSGTTIPLGIMDLSLTDVSNGARPAILAEAMDSGGPVGLSGEQVVINVSDLSTPNGSQLKTFSLHVGLRNAGGLSPRIVHTQLEWPPECPNCGGPNCCPRFWLKFSAYFANAAGQVLYRGDHVLVFEVPVGSGLGFGNVSSMPSSDEIPDAFHLMFDVQQPGVAVLKKAGTPLFDVQMNASVFDFEVVTAANPWTGSESVAFWAQPSIMGATTQLRLDRSLAQTLQMRLYDVAGRAVRTLSIPAGGVFTVWDGRDAHGNTVASGLYLARTLGPRVVQTARIIKLR
jgi:FlgD Ig-like domain